KSGNYNGLGQSYYALGNFESALVNFKKYAEMEPKNWLPYNWTGWTYLKLKKYEDAIIQLKIANNIKDTSGSYSGLGQAYYYQENFNSALVNFKKYVEMEPKNWLAYHWLGWTYTHMKKHEDAIVQFKISNNLKENPGNYNGLGQSYYSQGNFRSAIVNFKKHAEMEPKSSDPYNWLGGIYVIQERYEDAIIQFKRANSLKETSKTYIGLGKSYLRLENYQKADSAFSNAIKIAKSDNEKTQCEFHLISSYIIQGKYQKAYDILGSKPYIGMEYRAGDSGIKIINIVKGSPADISGLRTGDLLTNFGGKNLMGMTNMQFSEKIIQKAEYGSEVSLKIKRDGLNLTKNLIVGIIPGMAKGKKKESRKIVQAKKKDSETGVRWAVIIGISKYKDTQIPSLRYANSDAKTFYKWSVSPDGGKYAPSHVKLLLDEDATGTNIKKALFEWLRGALSEDMVTIYFAGHGSPESPDSPDNLFLLPHDTQYSSIATTGFPMWDIETALKRFIKAKKVVVIADACHSGGVGRSFDVARRSNRGMKVNPISYGIQNLSQVGDGVCVISASSDNQFSQESNKWGGGHGVFTYFLLKGLKGDADYNKDSSVSLGELTSYLSERVRRETKNAQSPTVAGRYDPALTIGR
ncbi:MAG: tetratricopeptide repeat protein, partial [Desulfobacterales bacterium]|nr:tetratricopeptide repeat protein [Desulfobacterales bacterium]